MTSTRLLPLIALAAVSFAHAARHAPAPAPATDAASAPEAGAPIDRNDMCFYTNALPAGLKYTVVTEKLRASKGTYGSVSQMLPALAAEVRASGGDAVIHYNGGQRFGFWPWRMTHPVVTGGALKWDASQPAPDCEATGGELMSKIMSSNVAPEHADKSRK